MRIKNIGGKIIRMGTLTLLPGETRVLPKDFENNPVIEHFADMGLVEFEKNTEQLKPDKTDNENGQHLDGDKEPDGQKDDDDDKEPEDDTEDNGAQTPAADNNDEGTEKPAPKPGTTRNGRGNRNK